MKKIIILALAALVTVSVSSFAQNSKALQKQMKKEYKMKKKEYAKEGWKIFGSSRSIDVALLKHYENLAKEGAYEIPGVASSFKSKNVGKQMALNSACTYYAAMAGSKLEGKVVSDLQGDSDFSKTEFEKFYAAYKRSVEQEIKGELKESYSVIRENGDGTFEMQSLFIVNENAAAQARLRALQNTSIETMFAQKFTNAITEFIKEDVNPNE